MGIELLGPLEVLVDFVRLEKNKITADMFILMFCKYHPDCFLPTLIKETFYEDEHSLKYLENEGFIKITGVEEFTLRQKGVELFETSNLEEKWLEFLGTYPLKVSNGKGGNRVLKTANPDAKINQKVKSKYYSIIKDKPDLHVYIMQLLNVELSERKKSNDLQYMQNIETYINQQSFEKYAYLLDEEVDDNYKEGDYM